MAHLPHLVTDLALILAVAGITTLIFKKINQPVVLGYIIAGFLVGPHVSLMPTVADAEGIKIWSEIGVIFLLFSLGLEFSFRKLVKIGGTAFVTALVGVSCMNGIGFLTGYLLGWEFMDRLFLGAVLSISSTTIIMRAFDELGVRTKKFATLVFGVLIVQDLVAILLLVLLSTFSVSQQFEGTELLLEVVKLGFFLTLWFLGGIFFIPTFLKWANKLLNDETMLIVSVALCLGMVWLAVTVGFSAALGAFVMGSILAETPQAERIEVLVKPVRTLFAAVFFISVGMMIDPTVLAEHYAAILIIAVVIIAGMSITFTAGALLAGQSLKHSVQAGMSLAQIGEFSFIIASLGVAQGVTSEFLYPIAVAASTVTTFTTPFMIRLSTPVYRKLEHVLPERWIQALGRYSLSTQQLAGYSEWKELLKSYLINAVVHSVLIGAIIFMSLNFIRPFVSDVFNDNFMGSIISLAITLILITPFIWALAIRRINKAAYANLWLNKKIKRGPLIAIEIARIALSTVLIGVLLYIYFSISIAFVIGALTMIVAAFLFNQKLQLFYNRIERRFLSNLNAREEMRTRRQDIAPWDAHLAHFDIAPEFELAGKPLAELALREKYGINIALIERGKLSIISPDRFERLYPGDKLSVIGTDEQLGKVKELFDRNIPLAASPTVHEDEIALVNHTILHESKLTNKSIRTSGLRETAQAIVVGLERNGKRILNPESTLELREGDVLWIVGVKKNVVQFLSGQ